MTCYDIGANVGFYTLLFSSLVGKGGSVHSFEPVPDNVAMIRRHLTLNAVANVHVHPCAVSDFEGFASFLLSESHAMGKLSNSGALSVPCCALDSQVFGNSRLPPPEVIKLDIEGAEALALRGALKTIGTYKPIIFVATHGKEIHATVEQILRQNGYGIQLLQHDEIIAIPSITGKPLGTPSFT
jgi:FkbM family methyltransferase